MIEVDDRVQARLVVEREDQQPDVAVSEFTVTSIDGTRFFGSPAGVIDTADGWQVELARKSTANLHLPATVAEIDARLYTNVDVRLIGKGEVWRDPAGQLVPVETILTWELVE